MFAAGLVLGLLGGLVFPVCGSADPVFSPEDGNDIIDFLDGARESIEIEVYVLTSRDVVDALERARRRGVDIRIILEKRTSEDISAELRAKGFSAKFASRSFQLTHSKFIIVDKKAVLVGSHNLSNSALFKNREASVILTEGKAVAEFREVFEKDWGIATY